MYILVDIIVLWGEIILIWYTYGWLWGNHGNREYENKMPARVPNLIYLIYASYLSDLSLSMLVLKKIGEAMVSYVVLL